MKFFHGMGCLTINKYLTLVVIGKTIRNQEFLNGIFNHCTIGSNVRILHNQLPWQTFAVSKCF